MGYGYVDQLDGRDICGKNIKTNFEWIKRNTRKYKWIETQGQNRLEVGQEKLQKNLVDSLGLYTDKIVDHFDDKTDCSWPTLFI